MPEHLNPEHELEDLEALRRKYEEAFGNAQNSGDYSEAEKLKEELEKRLTGLETRFSMQEPAENNIETEEFDEIKFEKRFIPNLKHFLETGVVSSKDVLLNLVGMGGGDAMKLRDQAYALRVTEAMSIEDADSLLLLSYAGVDNKIAWRFRELHLENSSVLKSVAGMGSDRAWKIRDRFDEDGKYPSSMLESLTGLDSESAWALRESLHRRYIKEKNNYLESDVLRSIVGLDSDRAWKLRDAIDINTCSILILQSLTISLTGLDSERAWKLRRMLEQHALIFNSNKHLYQTIFYALASSLAGLVSEEAWAFRAQLKKQYFPRSLAGLNTDLVWEARDDILKEDFPQENIAIPEFSWLSSINGDFITAIGWRTARKYQKEKK